MWILEDEYGSLLTRTDSVLYCNPESLKPTKGNKMKKNKVLTKEKILKTMFSVYVLPTKEPEIWLVKDQGQIQVAFVQILKYEELL